MVIAKRAGAHEVYLDKGPVVRVRKVGAEKRIRGLR